MATTILAARNQSLVFGPNVRTDLRLLEVPDEALLKEVMETGVVIKGDADGEAILCTHTRTYAIKYVETSNTQLLLQPSIQEPVSMDNTQDEETASQGPTSTQELASPGGLQTQKEKMRAAQRKPPLMVGATTKAHLELSEAQPRLQTLHVLLSERPYAGEEQDTEIDDQSAQEAVDDDQVMQGASECNVDEQQPRKRRRTAGNGLYSWDQLLNRVQASEAQLKVELTAMQAVQLDGAWRVVDPEFLGQLLELMLISAAAEGWALDKIPTQAICDVMQADGYRPELVRHCLAVYGTATSHKSDAEPAGGMTTDQDTSDSQYALDVVKIKRYFAHKVLLGGKTDSSRDAQQQLAGRLPMKHFLSEWQAALPSGMTADFECLKGDVLVDGKGSDALVRAFPAAALPDDPRARFSALFAARSQWEAADLEPFVAGLKVPGQTAGALLLKYARASQPSPDGPVYYTAR